MSPWPPGANTTLAARRTAPAGLQPRALKRGWTSRRVRTWRGYRGSSAGFGTRRPADCPVSSQFARRPRRSRRRLRVIRVKYSQPLMTRNRRPGPHRTVWAAWLRSKGYLPAISPGTGARFSSSSCSRSSPCATRCGGSGCAVRRRRPGRVIVALVRDRGILSRPGRSPGRATVRGCRCCSST
jgi:hypothetical protein